MPGHAQIGMTGARGDAADVIQVLLVSIQPLVSFRTRRFMDELWQTLFLAPEFEQMGKPLGIFG
jgi:hypothetical protein